MKYTTTLFLLVLFTVQLCAQDLFLPVTTHSHNAHFHYEQGMLRAYNADFASFDENMARAIRADSTFFMAWYQKAIFAIYFDDQPGFESYADQATNLDIDLNPAERHLKKILLSLRADPAQYVGDEFANISDMYPWVLEAQSAVSFYERRQKNYDLAIGSARRSVSLRPDFGPGYNTLAYAYLAAGKIEYAEAAMNQYRRLQPDEPNPYDSLGDLWMKKGDYQKAAANYQMAYDKDPNWVAGKEKAAEALKAFESANH